MNQITSSSSLYITISKESRKQDLDKLWNNENVKSLTIRDISPTQETIVFQLLPSLPNLESLNLNQSFLEKFDSFDRDLCKQYTLKSLNSIRYVSISGPITQGMLQLPTNIERLYIDQIDWDEDAISYLVTFINQLNSLSDLRIFNSGLGDGLNLLNSLKAKQSLQILTLPIKIQDEIAINIIADIVDNNINLRTLRIQASGNEFDSTFEFKGTGISLDAVEQLCDIIQHCKILEIIKIHTYQPDDDDDQSWNQQPYLNLIMDSLLKNTTLSQFQYFNNLFMVSTETYFSNQLPKILQVNPNLIVDFYNLSDVFQYPKADKSLIAELNIHSIQLLNLSRKLLILDSILNCWIIDTIQNFYSEYFHSDIKVLKIVLNDRKSIGNLIGMSHHMKYHYQHLIRNCYRFYQKRNPKV
ncbi:hypothetical protein BC833DRAFT_625876 [Globomyces pollinis-pini]|nr:hypothetical protein BC833DRAFT_625876 [Globomyces pollinis-pini]